MMRRPSHSVNGSAPGVSFKGKILRRQRDQSFSITETSHPGGHVLSRHRHASAYISFLIAGSYVEASASRELVCSPGAGIWHPSGEVHSDRFHPRGGHLVNLEISTAWLRSASLESGLPPVPRFFSGGLPFALGLRLYRMLHSGPQELDEIAAELLGFFISGPPASRPPAWFQRAMEIVADSSRHPVTLTETAAQAGVHPVHLSRSFRRYLGCTFREHLGRVRLTRAFESLLKSKMRIVDVACAAGFADHAHLCRALKGAVGVTPSAFRWLGAC